MSKNTKKITGKVDPIKYVVENGYPETGDFEDKKSIQKFYKKLSNEQLAEWCEVEGLEYKPCLDNEPIHRMRMAMAILYKHFPKEPTKTAKKSKYADFTLEGLVQLAIDHDVAVEPTEDMRIMRMRVIMALRASKIID